jgi:ArsR family transcriptional regulator
MKCGDQKPGESAPAQCCEPAPDDDLLARLALMAKALSDPIRLRMLDMMGQGRGCCGLPDAASRGVPGADEPQGICVCEFQERFGLAQSKTSYHLGVLRDAGLVSEEKRGKWSFYSIEAPAAAEALSAIRGLLQR